MSVFVSALNDLARAERLEAEARAHDQEAQRRTLGPVEPRLIKLLAIIPASEKAAGLSITELQHQLKARGRGHSFAHVGEIGAALRRLGYTRKRRWRTSEGYIALWFAPSASS
jgi:hypothetical protein